MHKCLWLVYCIFPPLQPCMSFFTLQSGSTIMRHILDTFPFRLQPTQQVLSSPAPRCQQLRLHMFLSDSHQCCAAVLQLRFMISHFVPLCQLLDPADVCVCVCGYIYMFCQRPGFVHAVTLAATEWRAVRAAVGLTQGTSEMPPARPTLTHGSDIRPAANWVPQSITPELFLELTPMDTGAQFLSVPLVLKGSDRKQVPSHTRRNSFNLLLISNVASLCNFERCSFILFF